MIRQFFYISKYDWEVIVDYAVTCNYRNTILDDLYFYKTPKKIYRRIEDFFERCSVNEGFTYTDFNERRSFIIIGQTTDSGEFQHTVDHEKGHLAVHIAEYYNLDVYGEEFQYLQGDIGKQMFRFSRYFLCE